MARVGGRAVAREVGIVLAVTPVGALTVRANGEVAAAEGTSVSDGTGRVKGRVARVFGPVARPYLTVRLRRALRPHEAVALVGRPLLREG